MDLIKTFINICFIVICLLLLLYLLNYEPDNIVEPEPRTAVSQSSSEGVENETVDETIIGGNPQHVKYATKRFSRDNQYGTYFGPMKNGVPHGFGAFKYDNGNMYVGNYQNGQRDGFGSSMYKAGKVQIREFQRGQLLQKREVKDSRLGKIEVEIDHKTGLYEGPIRNNQPEGYGFIKFENGSKYIGRFEGGKLSGKGNFVNTAGQVFAQSWQNGEIVEN